MGRKRFWHGGLELLLLYILHHGILAIGDVGCRFNRNLCDSQTEICYDDLAFGKCIPLYSDIEAEDLYQCNLDSEELDVMRLQLQRLNREGYKWSHPYTQCILQTSLNNLRHRLTQDLRHCQYFMKDNGIRLKDDGIIEEKDRQSAPFAIVKFALKNGNSHEDFANEMFHPPDNHEEATRLIANDKEFFKLPYAIENDHELEPIRQLYKMTYDTYSTNNDEDLYKRKLRKKSVNFDKIKSQLHRSLPHRRQNSDSDVLKDDSDDDIWIRQINRNRNVQKARTSSNRDLESLSNDRFGFDEPYGGISETGSEEEYEKTFSRKYKHPLTSTVDFLNNGPVRKDNLKRHVNDFDNGNLAQIDMDSDFSNKDALYTEGGMVQSLGHASDRAGNVDDLDALLLRRELSGFKRRERLDVKKPGPLFSTNNYIFKMHTPQIQKNSDAQSTTVQEDENKNAPLSSPVKKELKSSTYSSEKSYENVDTDHVYIEFQQEFHTWLEGAEVVNEVGKLLGLNPGTLERIRVGRAEVTFKVGKNNKNFNATDVVNKIGKSGIYYKSREK